MKKRLRMLGNEWSQPLLFLATVMPGLVPGIHVFTC
jgi:hypothetical protein